MSVYIKGMEMPTTSGLYFVSVDSTGGRDKTVVTVERMLGNRDVRTIIGAYELVPVPDHGRLIDGDAIEEEIWSVRRQYQLCDDTQTADKIMCGVFRAERLLKDAPTIIEADKEAGE